jgi:hypothetical protein
LPQRFAMTFERASQESDQIQRRDQMKRLLGNTSVLVVGVGYFLVALLLLGPALLPQLAHPMLDHSGGAYVLTALIGLAGVGLAGLFGFLLASVALEMRAHIKRGDTNAAVGLFGWVVMLSGWAVFVWLDVV